MALLTVSFDLPNSQEQMDAYLAKIEQWTRVVRSWPGIEGWRAYRNPLQTTPQVMILQEYDTLATCHNWLQSEEYAGVMAEMRAAGCSNFTIQVWDTSPAAPD